MGNGGGVERRGKGVPPQPAPYTKELFVLAVEEGEEEDEDDEQGGC